MRLPDVQARKRASASFQSAAQESLSFVHSTGVADWQAQLMRDGAGASECPRKKAPKTGARSPQLARTDAPTDAVASLGVTALT